jgi:hypothetical protein
MAYTHATFDPAVPADGDFLDQGDDSIRDAKLDIKERLETLVNSFDDDPLTFKDGIIPFSAIVLDPTLNFRSILLGMGLISGVVAAGAIGGGTATIEGAEPGDVAVGSWPDGRFAVMCAVTAADTVTVAVTNITAGSITLNAAQLAIAVIKPGTPGRLHGELDRFVPHTAFQPANESDQLTYDDSEVKTALGGSPLTVFAQVSLPAGQTLVRASALVRSDGTATVSGQITRYPLVGAPVLYGTFTATPGAGVQELVISVSQVIAIGDTWGINFTLDASASTNPDDAGLAYVQLLMT